MTHCCWPWCVSLSCWWRPLANDRDWASSMSPFRGSMSPDWGECWACRDSRDYCAHASDAQRDRWGWPMVPLAIDWHFDFCLSLPLHCCQWLCLSRTLNLQSFHASARCWATWSRAMADWRMKVVDFASRTALVMAFSSAVHCWRAHRACHPNLCRRKWRDHFSSCFAAVQAHRPPLPESVDCCCCWRAWLRTFFSSPCILYMFLWFYLCTRSSVRQQQYHITTTSDPDRVIFFFLSFFSFSLTHSRLRLTLDSVVFLFFFRYILDIQVYICASAGLVWHNLFFLTVKPSLSLPNFF